MENTSGNGPEPKYPWTTQEVGGEFFVHQNVANRHTMYCNAYQAGIRLGRKFSVRKKGNGVIITRVA